MSTANRHVRTARATSTPRAQDGAGEAGQLSLIRTLIILFLVAFVLFEGGAIVITRVQTGDLAGQAASEAGIAYIASNDDEKVAETRAEEFVEENHGKFVDMKIDRRARTVSVRVRKQARTLVVHRIDRIRPYTTIEATGAAPLR